MDTDTPTTDLVIIDAEILEDEDSFGSEIAKTVATTAATSAVIIGGILAFNYLKPRIASWFSRNDDKTFDELLEDVAENHSDTPKTEKV